MNFIKLPEKATRSQKIRSRLLILIGLLLVGTVIYLGTPALVHNMASKIVSAYTGEPLDLK